MLLIRADANAQLGSGHIMRCLSIARELKKQGKEVMFVIAGHEAEKMITDHGFLSFCLDSDWKCLENELPKLKGLIMDIGVPAILIDSYYATENYLSELRALTKVIVIDDLSQFIYPADLLVNYHIYAQESWYKQNYLTDTELLLGCSYVPLREEFLGQNRITKENVADVLITTGGADALNIAGQLIRSIRSVHELDALTLHIVIGPLNENAESLEELKEEYSNIVLHRNVAQMSQLMLRCDIAISAGGSTLYELCACGVPTISFSYADNQLPGVKAFDCMELIPYAGDMRDQPDRCLNQVVTHLNELSADRGKRDSITFRMQELIDSRGAGRISEKLLILLA